MKINFEDISIVVQGPINPTLTKKCLLQLRKVFPGAEIILSTWQNSYVSDLEYDKVIFNQDPGEDPGFENNLHVNLGRQIFSTINGIKQSQRKYILKSRPDLFFKDNKFLDYFNKFDQYENEFKVFKKRIIASSYMTRSSTNSIWLFHPSDWCFFGLREDLLNLFDIELPKEKNNKYLKSHSISNANNFLNNIYTQYWGEQYIFVKCLLKNKKSIYFNDYTDITEKSKFLSEHFIINNFTILDYSKNFNFNFIKYKINDNDITGNLNILNYFNFLKLYKKYCDKKYKIPLKDREFKSLLKIKEPIEKYKKHLNNFIQINKIIFKWIREPFCILYYVIRIIFNILLNFWKIFKSTD